MVVCCTVSIDTYTLAAATMASPTSSPRSTPAQPPTNPPPLSRPTFTSPFADPAIPSQPLDKAPPSFIPAWRRPTLADTTGDRRPSVQFVPQLKANATPSTSRSSSARPSTRKISLPTSTHPDKNRRMSSPPPPAQFKAGVGFDTFANPAASDYSLTLNRKHRSYVYTKRSRTFLCGTDTNDYSDTALEWLLDELVDDGDEIVCLRVVEKDSKEASRWSGGRGSAGYQAEALRFLENIEKKNTEGRAISLVLEFSIGKVHDTIQQMIRIYEPAILVVGTRGRSLTGYQGLLSSGSVSKYCLQYSPVPVIVVRPSRKREAKKRERLNNPARRGYRDILDKSEDAPRGRGGHLLDENNRSSVAGPDLGALGDLHGGGEDEEARKVAEAIGYRDPLEGGNGGGGRDRHNSDALSRVASNSSAYDRGVSPGPGSLLRSPGDSPVNSDDEDDGDGNDEEGAGEEDHVADTAESVAAMLAYERAQAVFDEEREEAEERVKREREAKERKEKGRSRSRGRETGEGGGSAALGLLAQLDRGMK